MNEILTTSSTAKVWTSSMGYPENYFEPYHAHIELTKQYLDDIWGVKEGTECYCKIICDVFTGNIEAMYEIGYNMYHYIPKDYFRFL